MLSIAYQQLSRCCNRSGEMGPHHWRGHVICASPIGPNAIQNILVHHYRQTSVNFDNFTIPSSPPLASKVSDSGSPVWTVVGLNDSRLIGK